MSAPLWLCINTACITISSAHHLVSCSSSNKHKNAAKSLSSEKKNVISSDASSHSFYVNSDRTFTNVTLLPRHFMKKLIFLSWKQLSEEILLNPSIIYWINLERYFTVLKWNILMVMMVILLKVRSSFMLGTHLSLGWNELKESPHPSWITIESCDSWVQIMLARNVATLHHHPAQLSQPADHINH